MISETLGARASIPLEPPDLCEPTYSAPISTVDDARRMIGESMSKYLHSVRKYLAAKKQVKSDVKA